MPEALRTRQPIVPSRPDSARLAITMAIDLLQDCGLPSRPEEEELLAYRMDPKYMREAEATLDLLNEVGKHQTREGRAQDMHVVTDYYAIMHVLIHGSAQWPDRQTILSHKFERPLNYRERLEIDAVTATRTRILYIENRQRERVRRTMDALQVHCRFPHRSFKPDPDKLAQGWIGDPADIQAFYDTNYGVDDPGNKSHVAGRLWDHLDQHDYCELHAPRDLRMFGTPLTFVEMVEGQTSPVFFSESAGQKFSFGDITEKDDLTERIRGAKQQMATRILEQVLPRKR